MATAVKFVLGCSHILISRCRSSAVGSLRRNVLDYYREWKVVVCQTPVYAAVMVPRSYVFLIPVNLLCALYIR